MDIVAAILVSLVILTYIFFNFLNKQDEDTPVSMRPEEYPFEKRLNLSNIKLRRLPLVTGGTYLTSDEEYILRKGFRYYRLLSPELQPRFCKRVSEFMHEKVFEGRQDMQVTTEMKVLLSAAAIKLTFGLEDFLLSPFRKIIIYPELYYSKLTNSINKGEANEHGIIVFSWDNFVESLEQFDNGINLGFHEYSHALMMMCSSEEITDRSARSGYSQLGLLLAKDHLSLKVRETGLFRDYAFTNKMEFFAVSVENFFERPQLLKEKCLELYNLLRYMLNQDPAEEYRSPQQIPQYSG